MKLFQLEPDMYAEAGVTDEPAGIDAGTFIRGVPLTHPPSRPLSFIVSNTAEIPPRHFSKVTIPVWSTLMLDTLLAAGVQNFDSYPATLISKDQTKQWGGFHAINILGLLDCVDMTASKYDIITELPNGIPLVGFDHLVIDPSRTAGLHLFRLAPDPGIIIVSEHVVEALTKAKPADGWGISIFPVEFS